MSHTYSLICHETKERVWIGQGWKEMTCFYTGEPETMKALQDFLNRNEGKDMVFLNDDSLSDEMFEYIEYTDRELEQSRINKALTYTEEGAMIRKDQIYARLDELTEIIRVCKLNDGRIERYNQCREVNYPSRRDSYVDKMHYLGQGVIYSINGILQTDSRLQWDFFR